MLVWLTVNPLPQHLTFKWILWWVLPKVSHSEGQLVPFLECSRGDWDHFQIIGYVPMIICCYIRLHLSNLAWEIPLLGLKTGAAILWEGLSEAHMVRNCGKLPTLTAAHMWQPAKEWGSQSEFWSELCQLSPEFGREHWASDENMARLTSWLQPCEVLSRGPS